MSDLISRQDAIEAVRKVWYENDARKDFKQRYYEMGNNDAVEDAIGYIDALQSAEPKTGKWTQISPAKIYECSECGQNVMTGDIEAYKFCHGCGARMKGENHDKEWL